MKIIRGVIVALLMLPFPAQAEIFNPEGYWLIENERKVIHIANCSEEGVVYNGILCGKIHWIIKGDRDYFLQKKEITSKRPIPLCGMNILIGFKQEKSKPNKWRGGKFFDDGSDKTYKAQFEIKNQNEMMLEKYGIFPLWGRMQMQKHLWKRVDKKDYSVCQRQQ